MSDSVHVGDVRIHDYLDDELDPADARALEDHVAGCPTCAERLADFAEVRTALGALRPSGVPARDLWPGIERRLDPTRSTRILALHPDGPEPPAERSGPDSARSPGVRPPWRRLAYASGLVAAFGAGALLWRGDRPGAELDGPAAADVGVATWAASTDVRAAITDLESILDAGRDRLDPATLDVLDGSLATIDTAIAEAETALTRDPSSRLLRDLLLTQERAKVRLLTRAATRLLPAT